MVALLSGLKIEVRDAISMFEIADVDGSGELDMDEFVTGCITLRGGAKAIQQERIYLQVKNIMEKVSQIDEVLTGLCEERNVRWPDTRRSMPSYAKIPSPTSFVKPAPPTIDCITEPYPFSPAHPDELE